MTNREIKDLMRFFDNSEITKVKIKNGDFSIELQKGSENTAGMITVPQTVQAVSAPQAPTTPATSETPKQEAPANVIKSPMVGTFYVAPSPGAEPFVKVGTVVRKGQTVAIIEAMKIMNEIEAEYDCRIVEILVEDGQPVEFDMPLFGVEKV